MNAASVCILCFLKVRSYPQAIFFPHRRNLIFYINDSTPGLFSIPLLTDAGTTGTVAAQSLGGSQLSYTSGKGFISLVI